MYSLEMINNEKEIPRCSLNRIGMIFNNDGLIWIAGALSNREIAKENLRSKIF
jgi:hypothetical protein